MEPLIGLLRCMHAGVVFLYVFVLFCFVLFFEKNYLWKVTGYVRAESVCRTAFMKPLPTVGAAAAAYAVCSMQRSQRQKKGSYFWRPTLSSVGVCMHPRLFYSGCAQIFISFPDSRLNIKVVGGVEGGGRRGGGGHT